MIGNRGLKAAAAAVATTTLLMTALLVFSGAAIGAALPDGRGYELVTPPSTGAAIPGLAFLGTGETATGTYDCFNTNAVSVDAPAGEPGVAFITRGGAIPGLPGTGVDDLYEAQRGETGWTTESRSPLATQSMRPGPQSCQAEDHSYSSLVTSGPNGSMDEGSLVLGTETSYFRAPDGSYHLAGQGTVGTDPGASIKWIAAGGSHIIMTSADQLLSQAPASKGPVEENYEGRPVNAVYDWTSAGLGIVSLLPSGLAPEPTTESTFYLGASRDGSTVAFETAKADKSTTVYVHSPQGTVPAVTAPTYERFRYSGMSSTGDRLVLVESEEKSSELDWGNILVFEPGSETLRSVTAAGEAAVVNVSADASHIYFVSMKKLTGSDQNPLGAVAVEGKPNIYVWSAVDGTTKFVATAAQEDVEGTFSLATWTSAVTKLNQKAESGWANDTSRTTPDGSTFVFQSHATLTGQGGVTSIYRYSLSGSSLICVSCPAAGTSFKGSAALERTAALSKALGAGEGVSQLSDLVVILNVTEDGHTVFFNSKDRLVPADEDKYDDVYEWHDGVLSLVSSGTSVTGEVLYGMTPDGHDVFFTSEARLVPQDESVVLSIYDARVGGGFPAPPEPPAPCSVGSEACQGPPTPPPPGAAPETFGFHGKPNPQPCRDRHRHHGKRCHRKRRHRSKKAGPHRTRPVDARQEVGQ